MPGKILTMQWAMPETIELYHKEMLR